MTDEVMTIREMCDAFSVTPRALRFYEAKEMLFPIREGQKRLYTRRDRARLKLLLRGKRFGFSLEEIRQLLDLFREEDNGREQIRATRAAYLRRKAEMQEQIDELAEVMDELDTQIAWTEQQLAQDRT